MKILCCQIEIIDVITPAGMKAQQLKVEKMIRSICQNHEIDLVLLPELSAIEYSDRAFENLTELSSDIEGWLTESMSKLACDIEATVGFGMPRQGKAGRYISQIFVNKLGEVSGCYDKLHVAQFGASSEKPHFQPGDHVTVIEVDNFRFGVVICYDMRFGEYISQLACEYQLDAVLHPVAFKRDGSFASWRSFVCTRALENQIYWLSLNRAGKEWGHSVFCPPWFEHESEVIELGESETFEVIELDRSKLKYAEEYYPLKQDRRNEYSDIVKTRA